MSEVFINGLRVTLPTAPHCVGEHPPLAEHPTALVLFFDNAEQAAAFAKFCERLPQADRALNIPEF